MLQAYDVIAWYVDQGRNKCLGTFAIIMASQRSRCGTTSRLFGSANNTFGCQTWSMQELNTSDCSDALNLWLGQPPKPNQCLVFSSAKGAKARPELNFGITRRWRDETS